MVVLIKYCLDSGFGVTYCWFSGLLIVLYYLFGANQPNKESQHRGLYHTVH